MGDGRVLGLSEDTRLVEGTGDARTLEIDDDIPDVTNDGILFSAIDGRLVGSDDGTRKRHVWWH